MTMELEVALRVVFLFALDNHPLGFDFSVFSNNGFAVAPLLADTDVLPDGHASVHGRILSALGTYPGILGEY
jgi:hypothetical protein